jgi:hypothetical protein
MVWLLCWLKAKACLSSHLNSSLSLSVSGVLSAVEQGDPHVAEQLLPLVYDERRQLAAQKPA